MRFSKAFTLVLVLGAATMLQGQGRRRIAVVPDAHVPPERTAAEAKVVDALLAKLAENPSVEAIDRSQLQALMTEMRVKFDQYFDPSDAANIGKLKGVSVLVVVTVSDLDDNVSEQDKRNPFFVQVTITGVVHLRVSAKAIAVETASVLSAPTATVDPPPQVFRQYKDMSGTYEASTTPVLNATYAAALSQLTGTAIDKAAGEIYDKLAPALSSVAAAPKSASPGLVAGILQGSVLVNHGSSSGYKVGDKFQVIRVVDSGIVDPQTKQPILRKKKVCMLTLSDVDDTSATGSCQGETPLANDQLIEAAK